MFDYCYENRNRQVATFYYQTLTHPNRTDNEKRTPCRVASQRSTVTFQHLNLFKNDRHFDIIFTN